MQDIIVVGARCAGAPTAMLLARKGYRVLLVDRSTFPSDIRARPLHPQARPATPAGMGSPRPGRGHGLLASTTITFDSGEFRLVGRDLVLDGVAAGYGPRAPPSTSSSSTAP